MTYIQQQHASVDSNCDISSRNLMVIALGILLLSSATQVYALSCQQHYYQQQRPQFVNKTLEQDSQALCFNGFATHYSGISRTPLWSAEYLTRDRLKQASRIDRQDNFHDEDRLPDAYQAELSDYRGSGYDRGHLAPNADMANRKQQYDSFSLANMIPQTPTNNRYVWKNAEEATRALVYQHGEAYVVTGAVFKGKTLSKINDRVLVPSHVYKAVYFPKLNQAGVYYAPNDDSERVEVISLAALTDRIGIDVMPSVTTAPARNTAYPLPFKQSDVEYQPRDDRADNQTGDESDSQVIELITYLIVEFLRWILSLIKT